MSISTFRNLIEKPGCSITASVAMVIGIAGGLFYGYNRGNQGPDPALAEGPAIASVGTFKLDANSVELMANQQMEQMGGTMAALGPELQGRFLAETAERLVDQGYVMELAKRQKLDLSDGNVLAVVGKTFDDQVQGERARLESTGKLKKGATDTEFLTALKQEQANFDPVKEKAKQLDSVKEALADPTKKQSVLTFVAAQSLQNAAAATITPSDADLKASFDQYTVKRILINKQAAGSSTPEEMAKKAATEIAGGLSFEAAIDRYSHDSAQPGKALRDSTSTISGQMAAGDPQYAPLAKLKAGEISPVLMQAGNAVIYKLISKSNTLPKDFDAKKAQYERTYKQNAASKAVQGQVDALKKEIPVKWDSPGYAALVDWKKIADGGIGLVGEAKKKRSKELEAVRDDARKAMDTETVGRRAAILAQYAATSQLYSEASPEEKVKLRDARIESINFLLETTESAQIRLELVDLLAEKKDPAAGEELARVAEGNLDPTTVGQGIYAAVDAKLRKLEPLKLVTKEQKGRIDAAQQSWRDVKREQDKAAAENKKLQAEAEKQAKIEAEKAAKTAEPPKPRDKAGN